MGDNPPSLFFEVIIMSKIKAPLGLIPIKQIGKLLAQAVNDSVITCGGCETNLEADCSVCGLCGWENPLVKYHYI